MKPPGVLPHVVDRAGALGYNSGEQSKGGAGSMARKAEREPVSEKRLNALRLILAFSLLAGLGYELMAALAALALLLWLCGCEKLRLRLSLGALAVALVFLGALLTPLWAADKGLAPLGIARALPLPLMALCLLQLAPEQRDRCLDDLPPLAALMTLASFALQWIPALTGFFTVSGRLAGFWQYPNSFACLLLLSLERLLLRGDEPKGREAALAAALSFGLLQSGSRAVFVLALAFLLFWLVRALCRRALRAQLVSLAGLAGGVAASLLVSLLLPAPLRHLGAISPQASTLLGRLLYAKDALPVIARHPFGLGYLGYYVTQGSFQTGVYSLRWVHNDLLQLLLDFGWIPAAAALAALGRSLLVRSGGAARRVPLLTLCAHCLFDFDLEFAALGFVLLLLLDWEQGRELSFRFRPLGRALGALAAAAALWLGLAAALGDSPEPERALAIYPKHTLAICQSLTHAESAEELDRLADEVLALDQHLALAWDAKARAAFARGDFRELILSKREALRCAPYAAEEYADFFELLREGERLYRLSGDRSSAEICRREIAGIAEKLEAVREKTDPLAWRLPEKPELELPAGLENYLSDRDARD